MEITDADHGFTYVNHAFETTTGYSRGRGARPRSRRKSSSSGCIRRSSSRRCARPLEAGRDLARHHRQPPPRRPPDRAGDDDRAAARRDGDRSPTTSRSSATSPQARAQARALAASEARYRAVIDTQTEFIVRVGADGYWTFMNEAAERYIGTHARGDARRRAARHRPDPARGPRGLTSATSARHHARDTRRSTVELRGRAPGRQRALGALDRHRHLRRRRASSSRSSASAARSPTASSPRRRARRPSGCGCAALEAALDCYIGIDDGRARSSSSTPPPNGPSATRAPRRSASRWPS